MNNNSDDEEKRLTPDSVQADQPQQTTNDQQDNGQAQDASDNDNSHVISGYALKFNTPSRPLGDGDNTFEEVISPDALDGVDLSNVYMLSDHDFTQVLASTKAGTLKLEPDQTGLHFTATLADTSFGNDVYNNIKAGNTTDMSFGFVVADDGDQFSQGDDGTVTRTINHIKSLFDVSVCAVGAYDLGDDAVQVNTRSYEKWLAKRSKAKEQKHMDKTIIKPAEKDSEIQTRSYDRYVRSKGEVRDALPGLTTVNGGGAVIPSTIVTPILNLVDQKDNLAQYVNRKTVGTASGTYPIGMATNEVLATKEENDQIGNITDPLIKGIDYKLQTRAGKIFLSQEMIDDSAVDIVGEIKDQLNRLVENTDNKNISDLLSKSGNFQAANASTLDDVKKAKNTMLDPALDLMVVTNQTGFNWLDTLKDSEGRYQLQEDVTAPTGRALFGIPVVTVKDTLLKGASGSFPIFIGDLNQCVFEPYKAQITTQWQEFNAYAQGLSVVMRNDYQVIDKNSGVMLTVSAGSAAASK